MSLPQLQITEKRVINLPHINLAFGEWCRSALLINPEDHGQGKKERDVLVLCKNDTSEGDCEFKFVIDNDENEHALLTLIVNKTNNTPLWEIITYARSVNTIKRPIERDCQFLVACQQGDPWYHINTSGKKKEPTLRLGLTNYAGHLRRREEGAAAYESDGISYGKECQSLEMDRPKVSCTELGCGGKTGQGFRIVSFDKDSTLAPIEYNLSFYVTKDAKAFERVVCEEKWRQVMMGHE